MAVRRPLVQAAQRPLVLACNVYVSEGRNATLIESLRRVATAAADPSAALAHLFVDDPYNRSNFTFVSKSPEAIARAVIALSRAALAQLDLQAHVATHPRLGSVDHISCHPLLPLEDHLHAASSAAQRIAQQLGEGPLPVPTFLYARAHPNGAQLAEIRRRLGYFSPTTNPEGHTQEWVGAIGPDSSLPLPPDFGPSIADPRSGVCCVGALPWLVNFNVLLGTDDLAAAKKMARAVSERGGGLRGVQAMALQHAEGVEVACNLLQPEVSGPEAVESAVWAELEKHGGDVKVLRSYCTGKSVEELMELAESLPADVKGTA